MWRTLLDLHATLSRSDSLLERSSPPSSAGLQDLCRDRVRTGESSRR
jgi:hypothetical protein